MTAVVRVEALIVLIALPTVTGDLVEFVTVKVVEFGVGFVPTIFGILLLAFLRRIEPLPTLTITSEPMVEVSPEAPVILSVSLLPAPLIVSLPSPLLYKNNLPLPLLALVIISLPVPPLMVAPLGFPLI